MTTNKLQKATSTTTVGDSLWSDDGTTTAYGTGGAFNINNSTGFVGFNTSAMTGGVPDARFTVNATSTNDIEFVRAPGAPQLNFKRVPGSFSSPTALAATGGIMQLAINSYDGTAFSGNQLVEAWSAAENWAVGAHGTFWQLKNIPRGTTTPVPVMYIDSVGGQLIPWKGSVGPDPCCSVELPWAWELVKNDVGLVGTAPGSTNQGAALIYNDGTVDTTAGAFETYTLQLKNNRSNITAGTNTYTNTILGIDVQNNTSHQVNQAIEVENGEGNPVYKLFADGSSTQASTASFGGTVTAPRVNLTMDPTIVTGPLINCNPCNVSDTNSELMDIRAHGTAHPSTGDVFIMTLRNSVTYDTTLGNNAAGGGYFEVSSTRVAGSSTLTNVAVEASAAGGDTNYSFYGLSGVLKNMDGALLGPTTITGALTASAGVVDFAGATSVDLGLAVKNFEIPASSSTSAVIGLGVNPSTSTGYNIIAKNTNTAAGVVGIQVKNDTTVASSVNGGYWVTRGAGGSGSAHAGLIISNGTSWTGSTANDGMVFSQLTPLSFFVWDGVKLRIATDGTATFSNNVTVAGNATLGDSTSADSHTINGNVAMFATTGNEFYLQNTDTGQTGDINGFRFTGSGSYDTTSGSRVQTGVLSTSVATRSAGANNLTVKAGEFSATGAQVNIALQTTLGSNYFNTSSGATGVGYASGAAITGGKFNVTSGGTAIYAESTGARALQGTTTISANTGGITSFSTVLQGTNDTTASVLTNTGGSITVSTSRSAGANALTNKGLVVTSAGAQSNIAYESNFGDNYFNTSSGNTAIGLSSGAAINAKLDVFAATGIAIRAITTPVASTGAGDAFNVQSNGTYNTTAGALIARGATITATGTRSSGANTLTNRALYLSATSGQDNWALVTDFGSNYLNAGGSSTGVGYTSGAALPAKLSVSGTLDATGAATLGSTLGVTGLLTATAGVTTPANLTTTGTGDLVSSDALTVAGNATLGSNTDNNVHQVNGRLNLTSTSWSNASAIFRTTVASTTSNSGALNIGDTGTYNTSSVNINSRGITVTNSATKSGGAFALDKYAILATVSGTSDTNIAGEFNASGGTVANISLRSGTGSEYFNTSSGSMAIGYTSGATTSGKLNITSGTATNGVVLEFSGTTGAGYYINGTPTSQFVTEGDTTPTFNFFNAADTTLSITNSDGSHTASVSVEGNLSTGGNATLGDSTSADSHTINGKTTLASSLATTNAFTSTWTTVAGTITGQSAIRAVTDGTYSTAGGAIEARAMVATITATRSAGSLGLTNVAGTFNATGGQTNVSIQSLSGDNYLNVTSGKTGVGYALGATLPAKLSVTGDVDITSTTTIHGAANVDTLNVSGTSAQFGSGTTTIHITDRDGTARPTLSGCGVGATVVGNDASGRINLPTNETPGTCVMTFNTAYTSSSSVSCVVTMRSGVAVAYTITDADLSFTPPAFTDTLDYECREH